MPQFQFGQFSFDSQSGELTHPDKPQQALRHKVAGLLQYLIENKDRVISKEELLDSLWQHGDYRENSLTQSIRELRLALDDNAKQPSFVKTYPQRGYQWICPLVTATSSTPEELGAKRPADPNPRINIAKTIAALLILCIGLAVWLMNINTKPSQYLPDNTVQNPKKKYSADSLLVLPFINATDDPAMAWLELGLSDMLAIDLQRHSRLLSSDSSSLSITSPVQANTLLLEAELNWPTLPVHIRSLLRDQRIDAALFASVRLHNEQQVLDFTLIHADGRDQQGSISYPSLPASAQSISQQLLYLLKPGQDRTSQFPNDDPIAAQALAQGMQALQQAGALQAHKYFRASLTIQEDSPWTQAWLARSLYTLGKWQQAHELFNEISETARQADVNLDAFIAYWLAEMAYRQGDHELEKVIGIAIEKSERSANANLMAQSYRLQANVHWRLMDWETHSSWMNKADKLLVNDDELTIEADKLFYLGNPSNEGLEKNPEIDLELNRERLSKALDFYQLLGNQPKIAASQLAIAQNYMFTEEQREKSLAAAIKGYRVLQQPFELAKALIYAGFYKIQMHQGGAAVKYFIEAKAIATELGATPLNNLIDFYFAFATLDQGLDQSSIGAHSTQPKKLEQAIQLLELYLESPTSPYYRASTLTFLGWAYTDLNRFDEALNYLEQAQELNRKFNMETSLSYSNYSMMRVHLERNDYKAVIALASEPVTTRLHANYLARAYYEENQVDTAISVLEEFKIEKPNVWQDSDESRLQALKSSKSGLPLVLQDEPKAHLIYCESDWAK